MQNRKIAAALVIIILIISTILLKPVETEAYLGDRTIKWGMQGYDVTQLQRNLNYLGYKAGNIDGIYGRETQEAVKSFQSNNGLIVDGIAGHKTAMTIITQVSQPTSQISAPASQTGNNGSTPSRGIVPYSKQDMDNLARLVYGEARGEPFEGQVAVAAVVINRMASKDFGNSLSEVIFEPGAFTAVNDGQFYLEPNGTAYQAAQAALRGWDPSGEALYYWNPVTATNKWVWSRPIVTQIGQHVFAH